MTGTPEVAYLLSIDDDEYRWFQSVYMHLASAEAARYEIFGVFPDIKLVILEVPLNLSLDAPPGARLYHAEDATDPSARPITWASSGMDQDDYAIAEDGDHVFRWVGKRLEWGDLVWRVGDHAQLA